MSFSQENGYIPSTVKELMNIVRVNVNEQFSENYDEDTFLGTNFYKYFYALIQELQKNEVKTSEIVLKLQQYFDVTNEMITRPNTTHAGIIDYLTNLGYQVSTKAPIDADAGKLYICVNLDDSDPDYDNIKLAVCTEISKCAVAGVITQGTESESIPLSNGQSFEFKYNLPDLMPVLLRLTITISDNNQYAILSQDDVKAKLFENINARYRLGLNFEPQRYFSVLDAPWASQVLLEYSTNGGGDYYSDVYVSAYDDLFTFDLGDITVVEA